MRFSDAIFPLCEYLARNRVRADTMTVTLPFDDYWTLHQAVDREFRGMIVWPEKTSDGPQIGFQFNGVWFKPVIGGR